MVNVVAFRHAVAAVGVYVSTVAVSIGVAAVATAVLVEAVAIAVERGGAAIVIAVGAAAGVVVHRLGGAIVVVHGDNTVFVVHAVAVGGPEAVIGKSTGPEGHDHRQGEGRRKNNLHGSFHCFLLLFIYVMCFSVFFFFTGTS